MVDGSLTPDPSFKPIKRFRDDHNHLPGDSDIRQARNKNAVNINGAEHMEMIVQHMENVGYDKFHKPNPDGQLEVSVNMFIDTIQGKKSRNITKLISKEHTCSWKG